jgi:hypothetical protein
MTDGNRGLVRYFFLLVLMLSVSARGGAQTATQPAPVVSVSVNGERQPQTFEGVPLIFQGLVYNPGFGASGTNVTPTAIESVAGSWENNFTLLVTNSSGNIVNLPVHLAAPQAGAISLDTNSTGTLTWYVTPGETGALAPGTYSAQIFLSTTSSAVGSDWRGMQTSDLVSFTLSAPGQLTPDQVEQNALLLAQYDKLSGNPSQGITDLNDFLAQQPNSVGALALKGSLLGQTGQAAAGLAAYNQAIAAFWANHTGPVTEPPLHLLRPKHDLWMQVVSQSHVSSAPGAAAQVLKVGLQSQGVYYADLKLTNNGKGSASEVQVQHLLFKTLTGTGQVTLNTALSPKMPIVGNPLQPAASTTMRLYFNIPSTVSRFTMTETGQVFDVIGLPYSFSFAQAIIP